MTIATCQSAGATAVVVGLCAHGLAICRALDQRNVPFLALESNPELPGTATNRGRVWMVGGLDGEALMESLEEVANQYEFSSRPILFLTNDRMVETVGKNTESLARLYRWSWSDCSNTVVELLGKEAIGKRCDAVGLEYPRSVILNDLCNVESKVEHLAFPVIVKPTRPLSRLKAVLAQTNLTLLQTLESNCDSLPIVIQEYVPGSDRLIHFGALFMRRGEVLTRFEGRKLRSRPMGHTTIAISEPDDEVHTLTKRFFQGLNLSGPVSLELKRWGDRYVVIEPTVGRTDFWVDLCRVNGVNLPFVEYAAQVPALTCEAEQVDRSIWINGERDPAALGWLLGHSPRSLIGRTVTGVYLDFEDIRPFMRSTAQLARSVTHRALSRAGRALGTVQARIVG